MKILVTGAGGLIGAHLVEELVRSGHRVRGLLLPGEAPGRLEELGVEICRGDITRPESLAGVAGGIELVFHLATRVSDWGNRSLFRSVMVGGTENILREAAGKASRFVYLSSNAVYGFGIHMRGLTEEAPLRKVGVPYGDTKVEAEELVRAFCPANGLQHVIIRPTNVIGPNSVWVKDVLNAFRRGPVPLVDGGNYNAALLDVSSLVKGLRLVVEKKPPPGSVYNFCDDWEVTWERYVCDLGSLIAKRPAFSLPFRAAWLAGAAMEAALTPLKIRPLVTRLAAGVMGRENNLDCSRAKAELGWQSGIAYEESFEKIKRWFNSSAERSA